MFFLRTNCNAVTRKAVSTKIFVLSNYDCNKPLSCGFGMAAKQSKPEVYASVLVENLTMGRKVRSFIASERKREQIQQENFIIKCSVASGSHHDGDDLILTVDKRITVDLHANDFENKRIGKSAKMVGGYYFS